MLEFRNLKKSEREMAVNLADITFRDSEQISMGKAFPYIFNEGHLAQSFGAFDNGVLVSFMGLVPFNIQLGPAILHSYSLGSVCTKKEYMGKGIATELLKRVYQYIEMTYASILLISGTRSLYTRNGCYTFGNSKRFIVNSEKVLKNTSYEIREMIPADLINMSNLETQKTSTFKKSVTDLATLLNAEAYASCLKLSHRVLVAMKNDCLKGFVVIGLPYHSGIAKKPLLVESAGAPEVILELITYSLSFYKIEEIEVPVLIHEKDLIQLLSSFESMDEKNQGTIKIINEKKLSEQLSPYFKNHFSLTRTNGDQIEVTVDEKQERMTEAQLISFLFDDNPSELRRHLTTILPLPFPYTVGLHYV
ncbi:GNAT family N-acetyltransferase [Fredinandcohnia humi]